MEVNHKGGSVLEALVGSLRTSRQYFGFSREMTFVVSIVENGHLIFFILFPKTLLFRTC
jgi:hypothetical protein